MPIIKEGSIFKKPIAFSGLIRAVIILILLASNVYSYFLYLSQKQELNSLKSLVVEQKMNAKTVNFTKMFIENVLAANGEVNFETRLKLESAVRELNDEAILGQWQKFVNSQTEADAQENVKELLKLLINKI